MKQILCFGDSNTWGYDPQTGNRFGWGVRWTSILQQKLEQQDVRVIEEGLCGRTTVFEDELRGGRRGIDVLPVLLESHAPIDKIILMLGTNDCKSVYNANENVIGRGVESLISIIKRMQPQAEILLISPIHLGERVWEAEFDPEFNQNSVQVSHKLKSVYENIASRYELSFLAASDHVSYSEADMEHMNAKNHQKFAEVVYKKLLEEAVR